MALSKVILSLLVATVAMFPVATLAAPISTIPAPTRIQRQTLGQPQVAQISDISSDHLLQNCPQYSDHHCNQIQDTICLSDIFRQAARHWSQQEALEQAIDASRCAHISPSRNNLGSYFQDLVSFSSMFRRLGRADILPNANYSEVLCQLEHTVDDLNHTIAGFCEYSVENCSRVIYSCENDFPANEERDIEFSATCNKEILNSLSAVLRYITNLMVASSASRPSCVARQVSCVRVSSEQRDELVTFKETLTTRIINISLASNFQIRPECRLSGSLFSHSNSSVFDIYKALLDTAAMLASLNSSAPPQNDLIWCLENSTLPIINEALGRVAVGNQLLTEGSPYLLATQLEAITDPHELTACLVARLAQAYPLTLRRLELLSILKHSDFSCQSVL